MPRTALSHSQNESEPGIYAALSNSDANGPTILTLGLYS